MKWKNLTAGQKVYQIVVHLFALTGAAITGAWLLYQLGVSNNKGSVDKNNRYLADYHTSTASGDSIAEFQTAMDQYAELSVLARLYPENARLIHEAGYYGDDPDAVNRMLYALRMYLKEDSASADYFSVTSGIEKMLAAHAFERSSRNAIPWMNDTNWLVLKDAIVRDTVAIRKAAAMTGVDPRLIVACTMGEQIRLFHTDKKRESIKHHLGPIALTVQSQFSLGINGIKDFTAMRVEQNLKDTASLFYMGPAYEHLLDFQTENPTEERLSRLLNERNHLYSYVYTACILKQTMWQWKRSGYDISDRPDILFTLFNLGFAASKPHPDPQCGGSSIRIDGRTYTFGVIGNDFFYSGELAKEFPLHRRLFTEIDSSTTRSDS